MTRMQATRIRADKEISVLKNGTRMTRMQATRIKTDKKSAKIGARRSALPCLGSRRDQRAKKRIERGGRGCKQEVC